MSGLRAPGSGPFLVEQLHAPSEYELSGGHPIRCLPTAGRGGASAVEGAIALRTDPAVIRAGVEVGHRLDDGTLRAPDISVGNVPDLPGWVEGPPPLAVEYADTGQDEADLALKASQLLAAGTRYLWVVRLTGPRRVEVHEPGKPVRVVPADGVLTAPGVLDNAVPVAALYDAEASLEAALVNLLQRKGYASVEAVRAEGRTEGKTEGKIEGRVEGRVEGKIEGRAESVLAVLDARGLSVDEQQRARVLACTDVSRLDRWLRAAVTAAGVDELLEG
ncbi:MAG: Uma2 family endonuclease [Polyangiaceae bacterium]|nr:Uma2 family endonuclease [Polyangiaceae bacterium]